MKNEAGEMTIEGLILNTPAFVVPYANADEANHAPNENLEIDLFIAGIKTGAALLTRLGER